MSADKEQAQRLADALMSGVMLRRDAVEVGIDAVTQAAALLRRWPDAGEPVAWQSFMHGIPVSLTADPREAARWQREGVAVRQLYTAPPAEPDGEPVHLVATGEQVDGRETYTRHVGPPPPLCDFETLYTAPPAESERIAALENDIHSCHPGCTRAGCVNERLRREVESLRADAGRWRALDAMLRHPGNPMTPKYRLVRESPTFGDEHDVTDWRGEVDVARSKT